MGEGEYWRERVCGGERMCVRESVVERVWER